MAHPKISIITPSFNQGRFIEQTIRSVLDQNYPNLEYIIIDGGSTDNTVEIIRKYEKQLTYWETGKDKGQTDAINKGFERCTGDIVNWLNSDDYYEPGTLEKLSKLFTANPLINVVCGKEWQFNDTNQSERFLNRGSIIEADVFKTIRIGIIDQPCTFFRKKSIDSFFPLDTSLHYVMDRQLWWCYLLKYGQRDILQTDEIFTNFRLHPLSKSIGEGNRFEAEFDGLKLSLLRQLKAPKIVENQVGNCKELQIKWEVGIQPDLILAAFTSFYAERRYIKNDLKVCAKLMKLVKHWKGGRLDKKEWKLYIATKLIPALVLRRLKKLKN